MKLSNKIAVVTGGNSGIGLATAKKFAAEGAKVIITGRDQKTLDAAVKEIGAGAVAVQGDVSKLADLDKLFAEVKSKFGRIDVLFANAGVALLTPLGHTDEALYDQISNINIKGVFFTVQKSLPLLSDGASIILTASIVAQKGMENFSVYSASKAAVRSFARSWANDLKARKIRVNAISPGPIQTPIFGRMGLSAEQLGGFAESIVTQVPLARFGAPEEIADAAVFLASNDSAYVSGIDLCVDGGMAQI